MRHIPETAADGEAGFTLFEILIGLAISSLIISGLTLAMGIINRGYDQSTASIQRQGTIATGLMVFDDDISRIERVVDDPANPTRFAFVGGPRQMIYVLAERPGSNPDGLYWVRLVIRDGDDGDELVRMRTPFTPKSIASGTLPWDDGVTLLSGGLTMAFAYRSPRANLRQWGDTWEARTMLPGQVKLEIADRATGRLRVPVFVANLKIGAEAACTATGAPGCTLQNNGILSIEARPQ